MIDALKTLFAKLGGASCGCGPQCRCGKTCRCKGGRTCGPACNCR